MIEVIYYRVIKKATQNVDKNTPLDSIMNEIEAFDYVNKKPNKTKHSSTKDSIKGIF